MTWQDKIRDPDCELCPLHRDAQHVCLMGTGSKKARIMIVGEAPGAREDDEHAAFVGPAGQLLTELLEGVGLSRDQCYITNAVKCRPSGNATPSRGEAKICSSTYLTEEVRRISPTHILALGNTALQVTTGRSGITKYRGKVYTLGSTKVLPTFHPAAGLRSPRYLPAIRADFAAFARLYSEGSNELRDTSAAPKVLVVRTLRHLQWLIRKLQDAPVVSFDLETDGLDEWRTGAEIVTAGFSWEPESAIVVPVFHPETPWSDPHRILRWLKGVLEGHPKLVAHNGKFDGRWFSASGIFIRVAFDTMLSAHVLDENRSKSLESLSEIDLGADSWKGATAGDMSKPRSIPLGRLAKRNGIDCINTLRLYYLHREQLKKEPRKARLFMKLMMPASDALTRVERGGMYVDPDRLEARTADVEGRVAKLIRYMDKSSGGINYNSPSQVAQWLFETLKLPIVEETRTGNASTKESVLLALEGKNKYVKALLKYRKYHKFLTTYLYAWNKLQDDKHRLHTSYLLHGTVTGRLSSRGPNLQQVPRDPFIRGIIGAPKGWLFVEADYSQIELRLAALLANETTMLRILATGADMHSNTAISILKRPNISVDDRVIWGKHPNFGFLYGMGPGEPGRRGGYVDYCKDNGIEVSYGEANLAYKRFHESYPRLRPWYERQKRLAARYLRVQSLVGRVRHLPDMRSSDKSVLAEAERQAINSPVQGLASDICLLSLVRLDKAFDPRVARIVGTSHDCTLSEIRETHVDEMAALIKSTMEDMNYVKKIFGADIRVPIDVEVKIGTHWAEGEVWQPKA